MRPPLIELCDMHCRFDVALISVLLLLLFGATAKPHYRE
jgi:hypothetical protein